MIICDFCAAENPPRKYLCAPFNMMIMFGVEQWSDNAWAACTVCAELIDNDKWEELAQRSVSTIPKLPGLSFKAKQEYLVMLRGLHQKFREAKGRVA